MATRDLIYTVGVDAGDAVSGLRKLEGAVRSTMRTVDDELSDGASAGDKLSQSIDQVASQMREEFASAAIAAERLQQALKDAGSGMDVGDAINSLRRMGVSFDEITVGADQMAQSLKQLDDVRLEGVKDLDSIAPGLASKLDEVNKSADSSKSALANMVGNSAQSMGEVVGITGDLGVGIGQLGEYLSDATLAGEGFGSALKSMTLVAGPMLALAAATQLVTQIMTSRGKAGEAEAKQVEMLTDAYRSGIDPAEAYADALSEVGETVVGVGKAATTAQQGGLIGWVGKLSDSMGVLSKGALASLADGLGLWGEATEDLTPLLERAGITVDQWADAVMGGEAAYQRMSEALRGTSLSDEEVSKVLGGLTSSQEANTEATENAAQVTAVYGTANKDTAKTVEELREEQEAAAQAARDHAIAVTDAEQALRELTTQAAVWSQRGGIMSQLLGDTAGMSQAKANVRDIAIAIGELPAELAKTNVGDALANATSADALLDKLDSIGGQVRERIADAFATGGPEAAQQMASDYVAQVTEALGGKFTAEQVADMLGLGDVQATIGLAVNMTDVARAKATIEAVTGVSGETPFTASIGLAIDAGTLSAQAAQAIANWQAQEAGITVPFEPVTDPAALAEANAFIAAYAAAHPAVQPITGDSTDATQAVDDVSAKAEKTDATVTVDADEKPALDGVKSVDTKASQTKPIIDIDANVGAAILTMKIIQLIASLMSPKVTVDADIGPALGALQTVASQRPRVPATVYVADYPTAGEIQQMIGRPRIPVDIVVGQSIRITGVRE